MTLLIETNIPEWMTNEALLSQLQPLMPDVEIRHAPNEGDRSDILMLACVKLPPGLARTLPNLQLVQKLGAGVEAIVGDPELPPHVKVTRAPGLKRRCVNLIQTSFLARSSRWASHKTTCRQNRRCSNCRPNCHQRIVVLPASASTRPAP